MLKAQKQSYKYEWFDDNKLNAFINKAYPQHSRLLLQKCLTSIEICHFTRFKP